jgi:molybdate transport system regulatory protein
MGFNLAQALGSESVDKRLDILKRINEVGSISEAARGAGVSYKAAWQALETLSNLAGTQLVAKSVGGSGGGGAQLTEAGHQVLEGAALLAQARANVLTKLQTSSPQIGATGLAGLALRTSMRNHLPCCIHGIKKIGTVVRVALDLGDGNLLGSRITQESLQLLGLTTGMSVLALCKATAVHMASKFDAHEGANVVQGQITRMSSTTKGGELSIQLTSGQQLVGFTDGGSALKVGKTCAARIEDSSIVVGLIS